MGDFDTRWVAIQQESTYGTLAGSSWVYGEVDDESIQGRYDLIHRKDMSHFAQGKASVGKKYSEGGLNLAVQCDDFLGNLLKGFFPTDTKTGSGPYTHTMTMAGTAPSYSMYIGRTSREHRFLGMCLNRLSISSTLNEYASLSVDWVGKGESATNTLTLTPSFADSLDACHFVSSAVHFSNNASASQHVKSFTLEINLNRDTDNACGLGDSTYIRMPPVQGVEVTGSIEFSSAIYGTQTPDRDEPDYDNMGKADNADVIINPGASAPALTFLMGDGTNTVHFEIYKVAFENPETSVSGRDTQTMSVNFKGLIDDTGANDMIKCVLYNQQSSAY